MFFIDSGFTATVDASEIRTLKAGLETLPPQAFECVLEGIQAVAGGWSVSANKHFSEVVQDKKLLLEVCSTVSECYIVKLLDMGISVSQKMIDSEFAIHSDVAYYPGSGKSTPTGQKSSTSAVDEDNTFSPQEQEQAGDYADLAEAAQKLDFGSISAGDIEPAPVAELPQTLELLVGEKTEVYMGHVDSMSKFWVQLKEHSAKLEELVDEMCTYYENNFTVMLSASKHDIVAAQSEDGSWYRSRVIDILDTITVMFLDYGNTETVELSKLQPLAGVFTQLPFQAIECTLAEVASNEDDVNAFVELTQDKCLIAEASGREESGESPVFTVRLLDMGISVAEKLQSGKQDVKNEEQVECLVTQECEEPQDQTEESNTPAEIPEKDVKKESDAEDEKNLDEKETEITEQTGEETENEETSVVVNTPQTTAELQSETAGEHAGETQEENTTEEDFADALGEREADAQEENEEEHDAESESVPEDKESTSQPEDQDKEAEVLDEKEEKIEPEIENELSTEEHKESAGTSLLKGLEEKSDSQVAEDVEKR